MTSPRWLDRKQAAAYLSMSVDRLKRLVRLGKLPAPSMDIGPNSPRWDRLALDAVFNGSHRQAESYEETVNDILSGKYSRRSKGASRWVHKDLPLRAPEATEVKAGRDRR